MLWHWRTGSHNLNTFQTFGLVDANWYANAQIWHDGNSQLVVYSTYPYLKRDIELTARSGVSVNCVIAFGCLFHILIKYNWSQLFKVRKMAKVKKRYNQVPHLTHDTTWESNKNTINIINKSQEVSPFPAGDHKAAMDRRESMRNTRRKNTNDPQNKYRQICLSKFYWQSWLCEPLVLLTWVGPRREKNLSLGVCDQVRNNWACPATDFPCKIQMKYTFQWGTHVLTKLHGWSASVLCAWSRIIFSCKEAHDDDNDKVY